MLGEELAGQIYVKRHRALALQDVIGRSHKSIEFKHMNISAVLEELGMPRIDGYAPARNYQGAIFPALDRFLSANPSAWAIGKAVGTSAGVQEASTLFIEPPPPLVEAAPRPAALERLVRKYDPALRDLRNRALGRAGEALVFDFERERLKRTGRDDLARKVRWVAEEDGDGAGYDIRSYDEGGAERLLEVKTTNGQGRTPFYVTRNECSLSKERPDVFRLFRLYDFSKGPRAFELAPPLEDHVSLEAEAWKAVFRAVA